jgi:hypothetical protein
MEGKPSKAVGLHAPIERNGTLERDTARWRVRGQL